LYHALQRLAHVNRDNDYLIAKWYAREMEDIRFMVLRDYYAALEQILKENDKQTKKTSGNAGKT
jgi:predicted lipid-binding transport protein (Tim44 family)